MADGGQEIAAGVFQAGDLRAVVEDQDGHLAIGGGGGGQGGGQQAAAVLEDGDGRDVLALAQGRDGGAHGLVGQVAVKGVAIHGQATGGELAEGGIGVDDAVAAVDAGHALRQAAEGYFQQQALFRQAVLGRLQAFAQVIQFAADAGVGVIAAEAAAAPQITRGEGAGDFHQGGGATARAPGGHEQGDAAQTRHQGRADDHGGGDLLLQGGFHLQGGGDAQDAAIGQQVGGVQVVAAGRAAGAVGHAEAVAAGEGDLGAVVVVGHAVGIGGGLGQDGAIGGDEGQATLGAGRQGRKLRAFCHQGPDHGAFLTQLQGQACLDAAGQHIALPGDGATDDCQEGQDGDDEPAGRARGHGGHGGCRGAPDQGLSPRPVPRNDNRRRAPFR